jgi:hypothetical protein
VPALSLALKSRYVYFPSGIGVIISGDKTSMTSISLESSGKRIAEIKDEVTFKSALKKCLNTGSINRDGYLIQRRIPEFSLWDKKKENYFFLVILTHSQN